MVVEYKTVKGKTRGKWCHFEKKDFINHGLSEYYWKNHKDVDCEELKSMIVDILKKEKFIFFDEVEYKIITHFGKLSEFAVNYFHIE